MPTACCWAATAALPRHYVTVLDGIKGRLGDRVNVLYAEGCKITQNGSWQQDEVVPSDPEADRRQIAEAVEVAGKAEVIVLALGGNEQTSREAWSLKHLGDRANLDLPGRQEELVRAMLGTGKPVIVFLFNGRPLSINYIARNVPVIFECWYLGQESGRAVAEVLFGDHNPGGKLPDHAFRVRPVTCPSSTITSPPPGAATCSTTSRRSTPFGFGLSYTTFAFHNVRLAKKCLRRNGATQVLVDVTNTGPRPGTEVAQMYIRDRISSVTRPVKELKGFTKISLNPGETQTVAIEITPESLAFHDVNMNYVVEPGEFEILVGNSSPDADLQKVILTVAN